VRSVRYATAARQDLAEAVDHIAQDNPAAADRLTQRIDEVAQRLLDFPGLGSLMGSDQRIFTVPGTPFRVIYRPTRRGITILRVWHGARGWPPAYR
jgi:toxin ParE1/3/4